MMNDKEKSFNIMLDGRYKMIRKFRLAKKIVHPITGATLYDKDYAISIYQLRNIAPLGIEEVELVVDLDTFLMNGTVKSVKA